MNQPVFLRIFLDNKLLQVKQSSDDQIVIGRGESVGIDLNSEAVSPIHAIIEKRDSGYYVCDLGSSTGTKKNGQAILDVHLDSGDIIEVGEFSIEFYIGIPKPTSRPQHRANESMVDSSIDKSPEQVKGGAPVSLHAVEEEVATDSASFLVETEDGVESIPTTDESGAEPIDGSMHSVSKEEETIGSEASMSHVEIGATTSESISGIKVVKEGELQEEEGFAGPASVVKSSTQAESTVTKTLESLKGPVRSVGREAATTASVEEVSKAKDSRPPRMADIENLAESPSRRTADSRMPRKDPLPTPKPAKSGAPPVAHSHPQPQQDPSLRPGRRKTKRKWLNTYAPGNLVGDMRTHLRPGKGTVIEALVVWEDRVLNSYHFTEKGTILVGTEPGVHILLPTLEGHRKALPIIAIESQAVVLVPSEVRVSLTNSNGFQSMEALNSQNRLPRGQGPFQLLRLEQGELAILEFGYGLCLYIRYVPEAPRPLFAPFLDMTSSEIMGLVLTAVVGIVLTLFMAVENPNLSPTDPEIDPDAIKRRAMFIYNRTEVPKPPPAPPVPVATPVPTPPPPVEPVRVKVSDTPVAKAPVVPKEKPPSRPAEKPKAEPVTKPKSKSNEGSAGAVAKSFKPTKNKGLGSTKQGGSVKMGNQAGANAKSEKVDINNMGLMSALGNKGLRNTLDKAYQGSGTTLGLAEESTGAAGQAENRAGQGIGSALKETSGGVGKGSIGISGVKTKGRGGGVQGYGTGDLGGREKLTVLPGGEEEEFTGTIDREAVRRVVMQHIREFRACYEQGLNRDENLAGKVILEWEFGGRGRVLKAKVVSTTLRNTTVENCFVKRLKMWQFPDTPPNQIAVVRFPFVFDSK